MNAALRKAAILFQSLDATSAEAMLAQLDVAAARRIRDAAKSLRRVDALEQQAVLEEFFARDQGAPSSRDTPTPAERLAASAADEVTLQQTAVTPAPRRPFQFLEHADPAYLVERLQCEHPQTIALVVAQAPRALAADLLWRFPEALRADVLARVIDWQGADGQLLEEVERALESSLKLAPLGGSNSAGLAAAREILQIASAQERGEMLSSLARRDAKKAELLRVTLPETLSPAPKGRFDLAFGEKPLVEDEPFEAFQSEDRLELSLSVYDPDGETPVETPETLQPPEPRINFSEFARFDDRTLLRVLAAAEPSIALLALTGAPVRLVERIMRRLPRREANQLRKRMESLGPFQLHDVELAQIELARIACRLADEGKIKLVVQRHAA